MLPLPRPQAIPCPKNNKGNSNNKPIIKIPLVSIAFNISVNEITAKLIIKIAGKSIVIIPILV